MEKAALVFSLKLDNGHKLLCPWIDNACNETLARFPPLSSPVLVDNFRERCSALLQLSALPRISSSAIDHMQSPLLDDFLGQSLMQECGNGSAINSGIDASIQEELKMYYQVITGFSMVKFFSTIVFDLVFVCWSCLVFFFYCWMNMTLTRYSDRICPFYLSLFATGLMHFNYILKRCFVLFCLRQMLSKTNLLDLLFFR